MKLNIIIPLITIITGVLLPTNIAEAASSAAPNKQETVNNYEAESGYNERNGVIHKPVFSKEVHEIKFFIVLGLLGSVILIPEILYKSRNKDQHEFDPLNSDVEVTPDNFKQLNLVTEESAKINNLEKKDLAAKEHRAS